MAREEMPEIEGFQILDRLGAGGMGVVWRAMQLGTRRAVALKVLGTGVLASEKARRMARSVYVVTERFKLSQR